MTKQIILVLTAAEAEALQEATSFREAGDTSDLTHHQFRALMRAKGKLRTARRDSAVYKIVRWVSPVTGTLVIAGVKHSEQPS